MRHSCEPACRNACALAQILPPSVNPAHDAAERWVSFLHRIRRRALVPYAARPFDVRRVRMRPRASNHRGRLGRLRVCRAWRGTRGPWDARGKKRARCRRTQRETSFRRGSDRSWLLNCVRARTCNKLQAAAVFLPVGGVHTACFALTSGPVRLRDETCRAGEAFPPCGALPTRRVYCPWTRP